MNTVISGGGRLDGARIIIYSHDSFGLGHLRRCRTIAHSLVERFKGLSILILSGSPIIGRFDFRARVDFVRVPGIIKLHSGEYTPLKLHVNLEQTLAIRESIIRHTAEAFAPDVLLVDKEPLGVGGEVAGTLEMLRRHGVTTVLGLRDVMDDPQALRREWREKRALPALRDLYDELWVYGPPLIGNPLAGLGLEAAVEDKMIYTGYLHRSLQDGAAAVADFDEPFILVTPGGGGDGVDMVDWVLRAYESGRDGLLSALVVLGPFMAPAQRQGFEERAARLAQVRMMTFDSRIEFIMSRSAAVVAMGGYNTFCEILSLDKRALIVPRSRPRREQLIRARRARELGLIAVLEDDGKRDAGLMAEALLRLPQQQPPSEHPIPGLLAGLDTVNAEVKRIIARRRRAPGSS